jgi:hypothetical protein
MLSHIFIWSLIIFIFIRSGSGCSLWPSCVLKPWFYWLLPWVVTDCWDSLLPSITTMRFQSSTVCHYFAIMKRLLVDNCAQVDIVCDRVSSFVVLVAEATSQQFIIENQTVVRLNCMDDRRWHAITDNGISSAISQFYCSNKGRHIFDCSYFES